MPYETCVSHTDVCPTHNGRYSDKWIRYSVVGQARFAMLGEGFDGLVNQPGWA